MEEQTETPSRGRRALLAIGHAAKSSVVLIVALVAAGITCFFVPFDGEYLGYFDLDTLACLFCTLAVVVALLILDFRALLRVDYSLLLTFCAFFVFSGNLARIPAVEEFLGGLVALDPLAFGTLSCQVISNVPSAVLLSKFTSDYANLLVAVNIGGLGTPIASLASLITLNTFRRVCPGETRKYVLKFLAFNFSFLAVLIGVGYLNALIV